MLVWISLLAMIIVVIVAFLFVLLLWAIGEESATFGEVLWKTLSVALDPGSMSSETRWVERIPMLFVSFFGLLFVSTIIGIVESAIRDKILELRKGRSVVLESSHTLILGWSNKIDIAVTELISANESQEDCQIVILAPLNKLEMENFLVRRLGKKKAKMIIYRTGEPSDPSELSIVRPEYARSILLICNERDKNDLMIFKRALALEGLFENRNVRIPIVAELIDPEVVKAVKSLGENFRIVRSEEFITRILVQAARQPGLSLIYEELLSFEGYEIYTIENANFAELSFRQLILGLPNSCPLGILHANGETRLNPDYDCIIREGDKIILIAEDDSAIKPFSPASDQETIPSEEFCERESKPMKLLVIGWHDSGEILLKELDMQLPSGSRVQVAYNEDFVPNETRLGSMETNRISVDFSTGLTHTSAFLESIDLIAIDAIIILGYRTNLDIHQADTLSLMSLVNLRYLADFRNTKIEIATELLDSTNRKIAQRSRAEDFIASEDLITMAMTQLVENPQLENIFNLILTSDGPEFHIRSSDAYGATDKPLSFEELVRRGMLKKELVVGLLRKSSRYPNGKLELSPEKSSIFTLQKNDGIVVLAED